MDLAEKKDCYCRRGSRASYVSGETIRVDGGYSHSLF